MKIEVAEGKISIEREATDLDKFVLDFIKILDDKGIKYVIISGYVSILLGRSRSSEDVDIIIEAINKDQFSRLHESLTEFHCLNTNDILEAYEQYLSKDIAVRYARKNQAIPNMEVKLAKIKLDNWALDNRTKVEFNGKTLYVSPIELQISYKLLLGTEKDIEDARHLFKLLEKHLDMQVLDDFNRQFKVVELFREYIQ
ncbi:hypothetical protein GF342_01225 [Candidatus Woesearchaeota archaeon]|nr:hypothetical protein [Candidatus Woesearchaeota archaeon]